MPICRATEIDKQKERRIIVLRGSLGFSECRKMCRVCHCFSTASGVLADLRTLLFPPAKESGRSVKSLRQETLKGQSENKEHLWAKSDVGGEVEWSDGKRSFD